MTIHYNAKNDRFYNDSTGLFVTNIKGLLSSIARREKKEAEAFGSKQAYADARKRDKRRREVTPIRPGYVSHLEVKSKVRAGSVNDYLADLLATNIDIIEQEIARS